MEKIKKGLLWFFNSFIWLGILAFIVDIVSKNIIMANMNEGDSIPLINGFLHITYTVNHGAAFSFGFGNDTANLIIYSIIACGAAIGIITFIALRYNKTNKFVRAGLMLIVAGAIGNLIDRWFYPMHGVVDFIDFCGIWHAIFNFADSFIVIAAFMFIFYFIYEEVKEHKANTEPKVEQEKAVSETEKESENKTDDVK